MGRPAGRLLDSCREGGAQRTGAALTLGSKDGLLWAAPREGSAGQGAVWWEWRRRDTGMQALEKRAAGTGAGSRKSCLRRSGHPRWTLRGG